MALDRPRVLVDADPDTEAPCATYHYPARPPSVAVALALMEFTDSDVTDRDLLYDAASVNADALDGLFDVPTRGTDHDGRVTFTYHDYTVTVKSHGRIVIHSPTASTNPSPATNNDG